MKWSLVTVPLKSLKEHPRNPRQLSKKQAEDLQKSLDRFGLIDKPIINTDMTIIGGHQRIKVIKKSKVKEVECWMPDSTLSEEEVDELCILHNKATGSWDYDLMADKWDAAFLVDCGFTPEELFSDPEPQEKKKKDPDEKKTTKECPSCGHKF